MTWRAADGKYVYVAQIALMEYGLQGLSFFQHHDRMTVEQFQAKLNEAIRTCITVRQTMRREQIKKRPPQVKSVDAYNEEHFRGDVNFIETVMVDKFRFQILRITATATGKLPPTAISSRPDVAARRVEDGQANKAYVDGMVAPPKP